MAQIRAERWQKRLDILAALIPATQRLHRKSMSKIMQSRSMTVSRSAQTNLAGERVECHTHCRSPQSTAFLADQEVRAARLTD